MTQRSPSPGELAHYGVKGMKWGVRKSENASSSNYSDSDRRLDAGEFGRGGARRIGKRVNSGKSLAEARRLEQRRENIKMAVGLGVTAASLALSQYGKVSMVAADRLRERNTDRMREAFGPKGIPSEPVPINYIKPNRKGVYNISSL